MTNKEKAHQIAWEYSKHYDPNVCKQEWVEMGAREIAKWKDGQFESKLKELLYKNFYIHPHDEGLICSEAFDCKGDFDSFVENFIKELNSIQL